MSYYTYISINKKTVKIEETEEEHKTRMNRLRRANKAQEFKKFCQENGIINPNARYICQGCGDKKFISKYVRSGDFYCKHCGRAGKNYKNGPAI